MRKYAVEDIGNYSAEDLIPFLNDRDKVVIEKNGKLHFKYSGSQPQVLKNKGVAEINYSDYAQIHANR